MSSLKSAVECFNFFDNGNDVNVDRLVSSAVCCTEGKKGCNHDHSEEEWVMWADLAVSGFQHH